LQASRPLVISAPRKGNTTMKRTLVALAVILLASPAFIQADHRELVSSGEVTAVSVEKGTLTLKEIAEPRNDTRPGTMQSGVVREFTVNADTKFLMSPSEAGNLEKIRVGDRVTVHYTLGTGKNVATRITQGLATTE
jgi:Domain of unknown function (DUF5666)